MWRWIPVLLAIIWIGGAPPARAAAQPASTPGACEALVKRDFSRLTDAPASVSSAKVAKYGPDAREVCEVDGYVNPTIGFKIVLPTSGWNGKYLQGGCGGACGTTRLFWCDDPLRRGYACLGSDMGHQGSTADWRWAWNNQQLQGDFGYRSTHVASLAGKAVVAAFYGRGPDRSYFWGCSTGGRQAFHEAEFFPNDFSGIFGGAPPLNETGSAVQLAWTVLANLTPDGQEILGVPEAQLLHRAVVADCDMNDGLKDGLIGDPRLCHFDPGKLLCGATAAPRGTCLTAAQVTAARKFYSGPVDSAGRQIGFQGGVMRGSELAWIGDYIDAPGRPAQYRAFIADDFRYIAFTPGPGPDWKLRDLDFDRDPARLGMNETLYRADNPDLRMFKAAGGKFIGFQGWGDTSIVPSGTIDFYETVTRTMGGPAATRDFFRLYAIPGARHCSSDGEGADNIDFLTALEAWVEKGQAPDRLVGYHFDRSNMPPAAPIWPLDPRRVGFSRPFFPYPETAIYSGKGDPGDPDSWRRAR